MCKASNWLARYDRLAMPASVHDNVLVSYEVLCEERRIVLHTEFREVKPPERTDVVFTGVEGYCFKDDAFGNILFDVVTVPVKEILKEQRAEIAESYQRSGAPGPWANDLDAASEVLRGRGVSGFVLSSSYGMSGWVLAQTAAIVPTPKAIEPPPGATKEKRSHEGA
jgi:hypothetical protein